MSRYALSAVAHSTEPNTNDERSLPSLSHRHAPVVYGQSLTLMAVCQHSVNTPPHTLVNGQSPGEADFRGPGTAVGLLYVCVFER